MYIVGMFFKTPMMTQTIEKSVQKNWVTAPNMGENRIITM